MKPVKANYKQTYVSQYVPQPFELMQRAVDNAQKEYDAVAANIERQNAFLAKLKTHSGDDTERMGAYAQQYEKQLNDIMGSGDLRGKEDQVRKLAQQLGEDYRSGPLGKYVASGQIEAGYSKAATEAKGKNLGKGGWSASRAAYNEDYHRSWQQNGYGDDFDRAVTTKFGRGSTDINAKVADAQKLINEETLRVVDQPGGFYNEYYRWVQGNSEGIPKEKATAVIMGALANDQDVMDDARINAIMRHKGDMNAADYEKSVDPSELQDHVFEELATLASPGITGVTFEKRKQTSKFMKNQEAVESAKNKANEDYQENFGVSSTTVSNNVTGKDYDSFAKMRDVGGKAGTKAAFTNAMLKISSSTPETFVLEEFLADNKYDKSPNVAMIQFREDLKNGSGPFEGSSPEYRQELMRPIKAAERIENKIAERDSNAKAHAKKVVNNRLGTSYEKQAEKIEGEFEKFGITDKDVVKELLNATYSKVNQIDPKTGLRSSGAARITRTVFDKMMNKPESERPVGWQKRLKNFVTEINEDEYKVKTILKIDSDAYEKQIEATGVSVIEDYAIDALQPIVSATGRVVNGKEQLKALRKEFVGVNAGRLNNVILQDGNGKPLSTSGLIDDKQNLEWIASQIGTDKIPEPSSFLTGVNPNNREPYVQMTFTGPTGKSETVRMNLNATKSNASISKQSSSKWKARVALTDIVQNTAGGDGKVYDNWGDSIDGVEYDSNTEDWKLHGNDVSYDQALNYTIAILNK